MATRGRCTGRMHTHLNNVLAEGVHFKVRVPVALHLVVLHLALAVPQILHKAALGLSVTRVQPALPRILRRGAGQEQRRAIGMLPTTIATALHAAEQAIGSRPRAGSRSSSDCRPPCPR